MNLKNKLKGLPPIHLMTLDERTDRQEYSETQYEHWGISKYTKISGSKYQVSTYEDWKHLVILNSFDDYRRKNHHILEISMTLWHLLTIKNWLETTTDPYVLIMEDDYDLSLIEYWHFDWEYLMNNIPYDWDCIQLGYESTNYIRFYLCPKPQDTFWGPVLINRHFAQKLINLHYFKEKYMLIRKYGQHPFNTGYRVVSLDSFIPFLGKTYQLPLITQNPYLDEIPKKHHFLCRDIYYNWWQNDRDKYSLKDFFSYGKPNDCEMTVKVIFDD